MNLSGVSATYWDKFGFVRTNSPERHVYMLTRCNRMCSVLAHTVAGYINSIMIQAKLLKEVSPLSSKDCFILIERQKSNFNFPIHIHPEYELNYIENAKGAQRIVGDSIEEIEEEELVLVANPQLEHAWMDHNNTSQNIHEITIQFHPDLFSDTFLNKNQMISIRQLFQRAHKGVVFSREAIAKVRPLLKTLSCENDSFYSLVKLIVILHELSVDKGMRSLSTGQFAASRASKEYSNDKLNKITEYLNQHYPEVIRLADMAALVSMSEASFCRMIKQHTSKSFVDFLTDIRVGAASRALIDTSLSIAEIGYDCGFNNLSNFNRIFKKKKGFTPREFRDNYRKNKMII